MSDEHPVVVTLERQVSIPTDDSYPAQVSAFRCREHSENDDMFNFYGLNFGENVCVDVRRENVRSVAIVGNVFQDTRSDTDNKSTDE